MQKSVKVFSRFVYIFLKKQSTIRLYLQFIQFNIKKNYTKIGV